MGNGQWPMSDNHNFNIQNFNKGTFIDTRIASTFHLKATLPELTTTLSKTSLTFTLLLTKLTVLDFTSRKILREDLGSRRLSFKKITL